MVNLIIISTPYKYEINEIYTVKISEEISYRYQILGFIKERYNGRNDYEAVLLEIYEELNIGDCE